MQVVAQTREPAQINAVALKAYARIVEAWFERFRRESSGGRGRLRGVRERDQWRRGYRPVLRRLHH